MAKIKACVAGLGNRGYGLICDVLLKNTDIEIVSVCDIYEDRVARAAQKIGEYGNEPEALPIISRHFRLRGLCRFLYSAIGVPTRKLPFTL